MEAKELRIGNFLQVYQEGCGFNDVEISLNDLIKIDEEELDLSYYFVPIPLTEEWLVKFGFKNNELLDKHLIFIWFGNHVGIKGMLGIVKPWNCIYVHQLQNIYFALTGQELTLKT